MNTNMISTMVNHQTLASLNQIGRLRNRQGYLKDLLDIFAKQSDTIFNQIHDNICKEDLEALTPLVHKLKGSSLSVGAERLAALCRDLEQKLSSNSGTELSSVTQDMEQLTVCYRDSLKALYQSSQAFDQ